jgi:hypothetical protein
MVPGGEWSELPAMVGTNLRLRIHQAADVVINQRRTKVFQYWAEPEDGVCKWKSISDFGFFEVNKTVTIGCYGEVWTDETDQHSAYVRTLRTSREMERLPGCGDLPVAASNG